MIYQGVKCDVCGAEKKDINHWFVVKLKVCITNLEIVAEMAIFGWTDEVASTFEAKHICGKKCLGTFVEQNTGK